MIIKPRVMSTLKTRSMCQVAEPYKAAVRRSGISEEYFWMEASKPKSPKGFKREVAKLKPPER